MLELKFGHDAGLAIDNDNLVMIFGPIKAQVVSNLIPVFHRRSFVPPPQCPVTSHADTKALTGRSSLRLLDRTPPFRRYSPVNPRRVATERPWGPVGHAAGDSFHRRRSFCDIRRLVHTSCLRWGKLIHSSSVGGVAVIKFGNGISNGDGLPVLKRPRLYNIPVPRLHGCQTKTQNVQ